MTWPKWVLIALLTINSWPGDHAGRQAPSADDRRRIRAPRVAGRDRMTAPDLCPQCGAPLNTRGGTWCPDCLWTGDPE